MAGDAGGVSIGYRQAYSTQRGGPRTDGPGAAPAEPEPDTGALAAWMREALASARGQELERGVCLVGPHRDDLELRIGDLPARGYASHGESWSAALALRLAAYELLREEGDDPVLLLDDVFAELDTGRRERLAAVAAGAEQVLVTAAVPADVPAVLAGARFEVAEGRVTRAGGGDSQRRARLAADALANAKADAQAKGHYPARGRGRPARGGPVRRLAYRDRARNRGSPRRVDHRHRTASRCRARTGGAPGGDAVPGEPAVPGGPAVPGQPMAPGQQAPRGRAHYQARGGRAAAGVPGVTTRSR